MARRKKTEFSRLRSLEAKLDNWVREQENKAKKDKKYEQKRKEQQEED